MHNNLLLFLTNLPSPSFAQSEPPVDVFPVCGRVALFYSHEVAHEVMPSFAERHAVTVWYFDAIEHAEVLAMAKVRRQRQRLGPAGWDLVCYV